MKLGESKEDYLEAAYVLKRQKGYVRNSMLSELIYNSLDKLPKGNYNKR